MSIMTGKRECVNAVSAITIDVFFERDRNIILFEFFAPAATDARAYYVSASPFT